ncbi:MAG TPA: hypothetical protein VG186_10530 [Solirubrobacteraceae bacterium]|nr:hypothetical protein [Solirubrobacteraceae bacterium]
MLGTISAGCALSAAVVLIPAVSAAQAQLINLGACNSNPLSQPFAPWGDSSSYELAPGGDFETSTWTLSGGARIVPGSEPFAATGTLGSFSLSVPAGASAVSPSTCVDAAYPSVRFFVGGTGAVAVSVVYDGIAIPTGLAVAAGSWTPTAPMITTSPVLGILSGGTAHVSLELTGVVGSPQVDDVFVDPWMRGG